MTFDADKTDEDILREEAARAAMLLLASEILLRGLNGAGDANYGATYTTSNFSMLDESSHEAREDEREDEGAEEEFNELPYFEHFASGLKCWWYKHLHRSFRVEVPEGVSIADVLLDCLSSLPKGRRCINRAPRARIAQPRGHDDNNLNIRSHP